MAGDAALSMPSDIPKGKPKTTSHLYTVTAVTITMPHHMVHNMPRNSPAVEAQSRNRDQRDKGEAEAAGITGFNCSDHLYLKETIRSAERWPSHSSFINPGSSTGIRLYLTCVFLHPTVP